jgi:uncharacterized protein (DUF488 family)
MSQNSVTPEIFTIGHSTRPIDEFLSLLKENGVARLIDIRTIPRSRFNPQFNQKSLSESAPAAGIEYVHLEELGGLRHPRKDSPNKEWKNDGFRGFADYMQTPEFDTAIDKLIDLASQKTSSIMCAEAVPWRCHRSLVSDALLVRGIIPTHIMSPGKTQPHALTAFAKVRGHNITYPPKQNSLDLDASAPLPKPASSRQKQPKPVSKTKSKSSKDTPRTSKATKPPKGKKSPQ